MGPTPEDRFLDARTGQLPFRTHRWTGYFFLSDPLAPILHLQGAFFPLANHCFGLCRSAVVLRLQLQKAPIMAHDPVIADVPCEGVWLSYGRTRSGTLSPHCTYNTDPTQWLRMKWIDQYTRNAYRVTTTGDYGTRNTTRVKTIGDVLEEYEFHPESKCADADGNASNKQTVGLLKGRHIQIDQIKYIGKESSSVEELMLAWFTQIRTSTPNIQTHVATNGRRKYCRC